MSEYESDTVDAWKLTDEEWEKLAPLLFIPPEGGKGAGRPRLPNDRQAAEACLYRHYHGRGSGYRCFGWNRLPVELGVSPSTANRRFREWSAAGNWVAFWQAFLDLRQSSPPPVTAAEEVPDGPAVTRRRQERSPVEKWDVGRERGRFPVGDVIAELERAYLFFNARFHGNALPRDVAISVERARARSCRGYFCARVWQDHSRELGHIALHASVLGDGAAPALAVLLHEMVHLRNHEAGIRDCHPRNQYHNRYFRDVAVLSGLSCGGRDERRGYALTGLDERGRQAVADFLPREEVFRWDVG